MTETALYLDHAATTPPLPAALEAMARGHAIWANPSSPHRAGRAARAALEDARARVASALGWQGEIIFTSGASEALSLALMQCQLPLVGMSAVEHEAVLRLGHDVRRLPVDAAGQVDPADCALSGLVAVQQVNNETGVIQPLAEIASAVREAGGLLLADCAQGAKKVDLPDADLIAISAHKFGGPVGVGALLVRDHALLRPTGGQERGYRPGTENLPGAMAMCAALEADRSWMIEAVRLREWLDRRIVDAGGEVIAASADRLATIAGYRMPGVPGTAQVISFDLKGIAISAGSACSSGSLRQSHVLSAMGYAPAPEVIRVSIGRETGEADLARFLDVWKSTLATARAVA